jgi:hypothetical protein
MTYRGVIIEESLKDKSVLQDVKILKTKVEQVTEKHKTPWLEQWTLHTIEILEDKADSVAEKISKVINDQPSPWYADFKTDEIHYIIYPHKIFKINRASREEYQAATDYGVSLGIPPYQVDFSPDVKQWER